MAIDVWRYSQLKHFTETLPQPIRSVENLFPLEKICVDKGRRRVISRIYRVLHNGTGPEIPPYIEKWERELGAPVNRAEIRQLLRRVHATSVNSNIVQLNYKCLVRWYITPDKAHKCQREKTLLTRVWRGGDHGPYLVVLS